MSHVLEQFQVLLQLGNDTAAPLGHRAIQVGTHFRVIGVGDPQPLFELNGRSGAKNAGSLTGLM